MNLNKLFELQKELDQHIIREKGLQRQDLLDKKILALQVELGELAQNWRGFKFWSEDQEPRTEVYYGKLEIPDVGTYTNPLLEEYIDCLHFVLSIGNDINIDLKKAIAFFHKKKMPNIIDQFMWTNYKITNLYRCYRDEGKGYMGYDYVHLMNSLIGLGEMLGFTWEQIEKAYLEKNKINHQRQENGY